MKYLGYVPALTLDEFSPSLISFFLPFFHTSTCPNKPPPPPTSSISSDIHPPLFTSPITCQGRVTVIGGSKPSQA
ncbi:hypothetical protein ACSQ67_012362 [Phaseolus vulgaris]